MKKTIVITLLIAAIGAAYFYRDAFLPQLSMHEPCVGGEVWDDKGARCIPVLTNTEVTDENQQILFHIGTIQRVELTLDDSNKKTVELARTNADQKLTASFKTEDSPVAGSVILLEAYMVDHNTTGDIFIPYIVNYGGSGSFVSVGLFTQKDAVTLALKDSYLVGDRVVMNKLVLDESTGAITLSIRYLDRKEGESMAATPTVSKEIILTVADHALGGTSMETGDIP
jgi:hypothetical protein